MRTYTPTREILWNVGSTYNVIALYALLLLTILVTSVGIFRRYEAWKSGKAVPEFNKSYILRIWHLLTWALLQKGVVREKTAGIIHILIYFGFLILLFATTMVFIHQDLGIQIYQGNFYLLVRLHF